MIRGDTILAFLFFVVSFIAGILFGASFPDDWGEIGGWMHNWQTLTAGILAITAAAFTVKQMQKSDLKAERRHNELVGLHFRTDAIAVERICNPQISDLELVVGRLTPLVGFFSNKKGAALFEQYREHSSMDLVYTVKTLKEIMARPQIKEGMSVMNAKSYRALQTVNEKTSELEEYCMQIDTLNDRLEYSGEALIDFDFWLIDTGYNIHEKIRDLTFLVQQLVDRLRELDSYYSEIVMTLDERHRLTPSPGR